MKRIISIFSILLLFLLTSCSDKVMGYSVALWNIPEYKIQGGDILPVYIRSNISHVYVIGTSDGQKVEIPLWQLTEPVKKSKVLQVQSKYQKNAHTYASVKTDGLPCRSEPVNTSKQVYRLRKGEEIKILFEGKGQVPMTGGKPLEGGWYKILTSDGTQGWCFSYNLTLFEKDESGNQIGGQLIVEKDTVDEVYNSLLSKNWYPDYFQTMINTGNIDLQKFNPTYRFAIDVENNKVLLNWEKIHKSWAYEGYSKIDDNKYELKNLPIQIIYRRADYIVIRYTGENGKPQELNYVILSENLEEVVAKEKERRVSEFEKIINHGNTFKSSSYGTITFSSEGTFQWINYKLLVPSILDASAKSYGTVSVKYALSKALSSQYDGVITFKFEGMSKEVNFLYKLEEGALRLEDATGAKIDGNLLKARGSSPMILYFTVSK